MRFKPVRDAGALARHDNTTEIASVPAAMPWSSGRRRAGGDTERSAYAREGRDAFTALIHHRYSAESALAAQQR